MTTNDDQTPKDTTEASSSAGVSCASASGSGSLWWHVYDKTVPKEEWRWLLIEVKQDDGLEPLPYGSSIGRTLWDSTGVKWWDGWCPCEVRKDDIWVGPVLPPNGQSAGTAD